MFFCLFYPYNSGGASVNILSNHSLYLYMKIEICNALFVLDLDKHHQDIEKWKRAPRIMFSWGKIKQHTGLERQEAAKNHYWVNYFCHRPLLSVIKCF